MHKKDLSRRNFLRASSAAGLLAATSPLGFAEASSAASVKPGPKAAVICLAHVFVSNAFLLVAETLKLIAKILT